MRFGIGAALCLLIGLRSVAAVAAPAHQDGCTSSSTVVCTMAAGAAAGDLGVFWVTNDASVTVSSFSSDKGDSCTVVDQKPGGAAISTTAVYCANLTATAKIFTATLSGASTVKVIAGDRYSGVVGTSPLDKHTGQKQTTPGTGSNAVTSGSVTPTFPGELVVAGTTNSTGAAGSGTITAGTGFTTEQTVTNLLRTEFLTQGAAAAVSGTFTAGNAGDSFNTLIMTFVTGEALSNLKSFAVLKAIDEQLSDLKGFAVLKAIDEQLSDLKMFVVLCTPPGTVGCSLPSSGSSGSLLLLDAGR